MRSVAVVAICIALGVSNISVAVGEQQAQPATGTPVSATSDDQLHFVSVLTLRGEVVAVDPVNRLVTVKRSEGGTTTLEARRQEDLTALKLGDRITVRYFEGAQIREERLGEAVPKFSLKDGMIGATLGGPSRKNHALVASVEAVDVANQEVTLKGPDGSRETIMVANPGYLKNIKVGDKVGMTRVQSLALSLEKES
jgi:hypothetical protein